MFNVTTSNLKKTSSSWTTAWYLFQLLSITPLWKRTYDCPIILLPLKGLLSSPLHPKWPVDVRKGNENIVGKQYFSLSEVVLLESNKLPFQFSFHSPLYMTRYSNPGSCEGQSYILGSSNLLPGPALQLWREPWTHKMSCVSSPTCHLTGRLSNHNSWHRRCSAAREDTTQKLLLFPSGKANSQWTRINFMSQLIVKILVQGE